MKRYLLAGMILALQFIHTSSAWGQTSTWTNDANGIFSTASNWTGGVPGAASTAVFNASPNAYTVSFTSAPTNFALNVNDGVVTFDFNANSYTLTKATNAVIVGGTGFSATGEPAHLTIREGTLFSTSSLIGQGSGIPGQVTVTTSGVWDNSASLTISGGGHGTMTIQSGGQVTNTAATFGSIAGFTGTVTVTGSTSSWASTGNLNIGSLGNGVLNITSGADVTNSGATIGIGAASNSSVSVTGAGSLWTNSSFISVGQQGSGSLSISSAGVVTSGGSNAFIAESPSSTGTVVITGSSSAWNMTSALNVGGTTSAAGGTANVSILASGALSVGSTLRLWPGATVNVDGGSLTVGGIDPRGGIVNFGGGTVTVTGNLAMDSTTLNALFGAARSIEPGRKMVVNGTATLTSPLAINGGSFSTGALVGGSFLTLNQGSVSLTNSNLTIGSSGQFGSQLNLPFGNTVSVTGANTTTINSGALLRSTGGTFNSAGGITNNGTIQLADDLAVVSGGMLSNNGTIRGTGLVNNSFSNGNTGQVQMTTGNRLEFNGSSNGNSGLINMVGGEIQFNGPLSNAVSTGLITGRDAIFRTGGLTNGGSIAFSNGTMDVFGDINQTVTGRITVSGGGIANFYDDVTIASGAASVQASAAAGTISMVVFFGSYNGGVTGGGTAFIEGDHRPGNSPGLVTFGGDVFYGGISRLFIELGGRTRGTQYDAIDVTGSVTVAGTLDIVHLGGFTTIGGEEFLLINNDGIDPIIGTFAGLGEGATFQIDGDLYRLSYIGGTGNDLILTAVPEPTTWALIGTCLAGAGWYRLRRYRKTQEEAEIIQAD